MICHYECSEFKCNEHSTCQTIENTNTHIGRVCIIHNLKFESGVIVS